MLKKQVRSLFIFILIAVLALPFFATPVSAAYENTYSNTGNMRDDIIGVALTQVGYTEGSNNYTKYGVWYGQPNSPWCGMFVSWCAKEAGVPTSVLKRTGIANPSNFGLSYQDGASYTPQKGDLFFKKSFSHVGFVYYTDGDYFYTVEGNTSTTSNDGNSVMIRRRKISDYYFSSPNYSGSSSSGCSHDYEIRVDSEHPHKEYKICVKCSKKTYTGNKATNDDCKTCIQESCKHDYSDWEKTSDSKHSRVCAICDYEQTTDHEWKKGKLLKEATCVDEGIQQVICNDCGFESTKSISATEEHDYTDFSYIDEQNHQTVCTGCEEKVISSHTLSENWQHDTLYHWTSCKDCGGRIQHIEHTFPNGCTEPCETCGFVLEQGHKLDGELHHDDQAHWNICTRCGQETEKADHLYTSECDEICNTCNYKRSATNAHHDEYLSDEAGHWRRCTVCRRETDTVSHVADQNVEEWETLQCIHCNFELRSSDRHIHTYTITQYDEVTHWGICECGETLDAEIHSWDFQSGVCSVCNASNNTAEEASFIQFIISLWNSLWNK